MERHGQAGVVGPGFVAEQFETDLDVGERGVVRRRSDGQPAGAEVQLGEVQPFGVVGDQGSPTVEVFDDRQEPGVVQADSGLLHPQSDRAVDRLTVGFGDQFVGGQLHAVVAEAVHRIERAAVRVPVPGEPHRADEPIVVVEREYELLAHRLHQALGHAGRITSGDRRERVEVERVPDARGQLQHALRVLGQPAQARDHELRDVGADTGGVRPGRGPRSTPRPGRTGSNRRRAARRGAAR